MLPQNAVLRRTIPILLQSAGAHRKPRWLPVAKSKIFRIPKRPEISEDERLELLRINNNYKTQMRAIRRFYYEDMIREKATLDDATSEMSIKLEAEEWERCMKVNEQWNAQVAAEREERRKQELIAMEERALTKMEEKDRELQVRIEKASEQIRRQKELSATFITPETLDAAIDHALANVIDYNYAINLQGEKFIGRETAQPKTDQQAASANP